MRLDTAINDYQRSRDRLLKMIGERFPWGTVVRLKIEGDFAIVVSGAQFAHSVALLRENGNVWDTIATNLEAVKDESKWPNWVKIQRPKMVEP